MNKLINKCDKYLYPDFQDNWDNVLFKERVVSHINSNNKVLDLGAGAGIIEQVNFKGIASFVCGVDIDNRVFTNPYLDEAKLGHAESIPYKDDFFDIVICNNVFEHLSDPVKVFREVRRVLKTEGMFIIKTPNKYHYVPLFARLTPHWFHVHYNLIRGRAEEDTFPTFYRANSQNAITYYSKLTGFEVDKMELIEGRPEYLRVTFLTYLLGKLYEKIVNSTDFLRNFRVLLLVSLRKK